MLKSLSLLTFLMISGLEFTSAAPSCKQLVLGGSPGVAIGLTEADRPSELNLVSSSFEASHDKKEVSRQVSEVVGMMAQARGPIISDKEINEKSKITLGLSIGNGFSLELKYKHMLHETEGEIYVLDHINMYTPSGKQMDVSSNPIDAYDIRKLAVNRNNFEIGTYPDGYNISANVATIIKGDVLKEIRALAPKLELVPKEEIRQLAKESDLAVLKKKANRTYMKYFIKKYSVRGIFKTAFKLVIYEPLKAFITVGVAALFLSTHSPGMMNKISDIFLPKEPQKIEWVKRSLDEHSQGTNMPEKVKQQLRTLREGLEASEPRATVSNGDAMNLNAPRLQTASDEYMWTTTITDKSSGKSMTLIFLSHDNKQGEIKYIALQVDPAKYKDLIQYIKTAGQFIPVSDEDLK